MRQERREYDTALGILQSPAETSCDLRNREQAIRAGAPGGADGTQGVDEGPVPATAAEDCV